MSLEKNEVGTVFLGRYRFQGERSISEGVCDCGGRYAILIRSYIDLQSEDAAGRVETSVRTACHCAEERDPFRIKPAPMHKLTGGGSTPWRVEKQ